MRTLAAALLALVAAAPLTAQQTPSDPLGQPLLDDARHGVIDGMRMKAWLREVDAISLADRDRGNVFWGRNVGSRGHVATQDWVERYSRQYGLPDVHRQRSDLAPPMRWWLQARPAVLDIVTDSFNPFNVGVTADMDLGASGEMGRVARLLPSLQVITSPEIKHTEQDTLEWVPALGLEQIARAYARIIDGLGTLERSELAPRPSAQQPQNAKARPPHR